MSKIKELYLEMMVIDKAGNIIKLPDGLTFIPVFLKQTNKKNNKRSKSIDTQIKIVKIQLNNFY
jgi:hypothetical protein